MKSLANAAAAPAAVPAAALAPTTSATPAAAPSSAASAALDKAPAAKATAPIAAAVSTAAATEEHDDDSDIDDSMLAGALGAMLKASSEPKPALPKPPSAVPSKESRPPIPTKSKPPLRREEPSLDEKAKAVPDKPLMTKTKAGAAWGAPPPLRPGSRTQRGRPKEGEVAAPPKGIGARPKVAAVPKEVAPPPLFDQWLACLKFITGWNDQGKHTAEEIRDALREHLADEGINHSKCMSELASTIVPLLLDVRQTDQAVVKNLRADARKGLRVVQVSILRIVTFELSREQDAKEALRNKRRDAKAAAAAKSGKGGAMVNGEAKEADKTLVLKKPYLTSDISSLAKVVQHFRFDRTFSQGLHQLILSIRRQKRAGAGESAKTAGGAVDADDKTKPRNGTKRGQMENTGIPAKPVESANKRRATGTTCAAAACDEDEGAEVAETCNKPVAPPLPKRSRISSAS